MTVDGINGRRRRNREGEESTKFSLDVKNSGLTRDGTADLPQRDRILRVAMPTKTTFVERALLVVLLGSPAGKSFAPYQQTAPSLCHTRRWTRTRHPLTQSGSGCLEGERRRPAGLPLRSSSPREWEERHVDNRGMTEFGWGWLRSGRRRRTCLEAGDKGDEVLKMKSMGSSIKNEDKVLTGGEDDMRRAMFDMDPDSDRQGPMYFGTDGFDGPEKLWDKPLEEIRFAECYVVFCIDREERPDEPKNFPFWGVRQAVHREHLKWARILARTLENDTDRDAAVLWDRTILSPSKYKTIGNIMCVRAHSKEAAIRLLESDPFRAADLYETVSLYRYPYSTAGEFNWQLAAHPYVALSMDREGQSRLREDNFPRHLEYLGNTKRCTGVGPIFDPSLDKDDPASAPVGSLVFFNAATDEEARETVENDPLNEAGLFESMFIARFNDLDLSGLHLAYPSRDDPLRDIIAKEGLAVGDDFPKDPDWKPFSNLTWLQVENDKRRDEEYLEKRKEFYEQRDIRLEYNRTNKDAKFYHGVYVYVGRRNETEWYDYWPTYLGPNDEWNTERFDLKNSYPPVDIYEDDL
ncbi:unnamed protein product [Ascophyllum nodosum]